MKKLQCISMMIFTIFALGCKTQLGVAKRSQASPTAITLARGVEPYWQVEVSDYEMLFRTAGEGASNFPTPIPVKEGNSLIYTTQSKKNLKETFLTLTITTKACYDPVLKKELPYTVVGKRDNQVLVGCAM